MSNRLYAKRFQESLQKLIEDQHIGADTVAEVVDRPVRTIYKWLAGTQSPRKADLQNICLKFGWDYKALFLEGVILDQVLYQNFLSFEALDSRYREMSKRSPFEALSIVCMASAKAFSYLVSKGLECALAGDATMNCSILTLDPVLSGSLLVIGVNEASGIRVRLCDSKFQNIGEWKPLTEDGLDFYYDVLKTYKKNCYG